MRKGTIIGIILALLLVGFSEGLDTVRRVDSSYLNEPLHQMQDSEMLEVCIEEEIPL